MKQVLLTGLTSFTGVHIALALLQNGYKVDAPLRLAKLDYAGLKEARLNLLEGQNHLNLIDNLDLASAEFPDAVARMRPAVFINHGGFIHNYRSLNFDVIKHLETNLQYIQFLVERLKECGCELFIYTGSAFEPGEFAPYGVSPYGVAKQMVWSLIAYWCYFYRLPLIKIIIPNPYGLLENEDRLLPTFKRHIEAGRPVKLQNSGQVGNNILVSDLATYYVQAVQKAG